MEILHGERKRSSILILTATLLFLALIQPAHAATVTNISDSGPGSLRQAILDAVTGDTISADPAVLGVITLSSELTITRNVTIVGPGARKFTISSGTSATLILTDVMITNNSVAGSTGGGIYNNGTLTLNRVTIDEKD